MKKSANLKTKQETTDVRGLGIFSDYSRKQVAGKQSAPTTMAANRKNVRTFRWEHWL